MIIEMKVFSFLRQNTPISGNWFGRLASFFDHRFGDGWEDKDKKFWQEFHKSHRVSKE